MRAQQTPEPSGVNVPRYVGVMRAVRVQVRIAHDAQGARRIRLQHVDNSHPDATAKHPQPPDTAGPGARDSTSSGADVALITPREVISWDVAAFSIQSVSTAVASGAPAASRWKVSANAMEGLS
jgi:hypothetical protein